MSTRASSEDRRKLARRIERAAIDAGADPAEAKRQAAEFAGVKPPADPKPASSKRSKPASSKRSKPKRSKRSKRSKIPTPNLPAAASLGALFSQSLGLVVLYWLVRSAAGAADILASIRRGFTWWISTDGIPTNPRGNQ